MCVDSQLLAVSVEAPNLLNNTGLLSLTQLAAIHKLCKSLAGTKLMLDQPALLSSS